MTALHLIQLTQIESMSRRRKPEEVLINVDHIGAIMPRTGYTTIVVHGAFIHVTESVDEILSALGPVSYD